MNRIFILLFILVSGLASAQVLLINELDCDNPSTDTQEFVELKSQAPNFPTDGYVLVFFNGSESGGDSSYFALDLTGYATDNNGLLVLGSRGVSPYPQVTFADNLIQNGADAVAIYQAAIVDFPEGTVATVTDLVDVLIYGTSDADDLTLIDIFDDAPGFSMIQQINEGSGNNTNSIQRNSDGTYFSGVPTPRRENDGSGIPINPVSISVPDTQFEEGTTFDISFTSEVNVTTDLNFTISLDNFDFNSTDFSGNLSLTIPNGQNTTSTTITLLDDTEDEGDEILRIRFLDLVEPIVPANNNIEIRVVDNDFTAAPWGTPLNPTFSSVESTQPNGYYNSLDGLADVALSQALQDIIADPNTVRAQTYADVIDILKAADQNPENSNEVWLVYTEEGRSKLDFQTSSNSAGKWNREHTFPRSRGGFFDIEEDEIADGIDIFWTTEADSLRHGNSDAHALRAVDASENSSRGNKHYGDYTGPSGTLGSFRGDVARSVLYMEIRYNGLQVMNGFPDTVGQLGDLATLLDWHRNDPPDDFEMNRNNIVYNWQRNRNPFIDQPLLVEYIWGDNVGDPWFQSLSVEDYNASKISVHPIPTKGDVYISGLSINTAIKIFSSDGKLVKQLKNFTQPLRLDLAQGLYILKLQDGTSVVTRKLIIK